MDKRLKALEEFERPHGFPRFAVPREKVRDSNVFVILLALTIGGVVGYLVS